MFIPLHDANALKHIKLQYVTLTLIALNVLAYLFVNVVTDPATMQATFVSFGYIPAVVNDFEELPIELVYIPENLSLISYSFLHGDFMHLMGNMLFLWVFGDNIEDALGHFKFLIFYLLCAIAGALAHGFMDQVSIAPLIGASGAVAGIIGAYLVLHPKVRVWVLAFSRLPLRLPAYIPLLFWIAFQIFMVFALPDDAVSWGAHIGGFLAGAILVVFMRRRGVPLFDQNVVTPQAVIVEPESVVLKTDERDTNIWGRGSST
ncbi:rhomboid family intramembrane serine protease [Ahrensia sp. 13_GOM-1096m]|uniref:rhomboid family intramembrane serine protease n=1 Tax=Ahrensia sp. 13_GOM-1096m TaxID=1380380 RepID=UPI000479B93D|nr:rhomboid family intramembrane serine protease [Ahrensia sp. 13_GOM-1096m]